MISTFSIIYFFAWANVLQDRLFKSEGSRIFQSVAPSPNEGGGRRQIEKRERKGASKTLLCRSASDLLA